MIRSVQGSVIAHGKDHIVVNIGSVMGGIGLKVFTTDITIAEATLDSTIILHTYLQVREDALTLYGFVSEDELTMFELLLGVNGVGPKVALSALTTLTPENLRVALRNEEPAMIARVPGIGKRTAQKIVLDLKDKVGAPLEGIAALAYATDVDSEVIEALIALGYSVVEAQRAVQRLPKDVEGVEERLRYALSSFDS